MIRPTAVIWVKRDARLADNACLAEVDRVGLEALPFSCFEPSMLEVGDSSGMHANAQWQAVNGLRLRLRQLGADGVPSVGEVVMVKAARGKGDSPAQAAKKKAPKLPKPKS